MPKIEKNLIKQVKEKFTKFYSEIYKEKDVNEHVTAENILNFARVKFEMLRQGKKIDFDNKETATDLLAIYSIFKKENLTGSNNDFFEDIKNELLDTYSYNLKQINILTDSIIDPSINIDTIESIDVTGKQILNTKEYKDAKRKKIHENFQKMEKEKEEIKEVNDRRNEKRNEILKEREKIEEEEIENGKPIWEEIEKETNVPKFDPNKKVEKKVEHVYSKDDVSSEAINSYIGILENIYNGNDKIHATVDNKNKYPKQLSDIEISDKLKKNEKIDCTVSNIIDRVAMYKAQKAKYDSINPVKRFFGFLFKDVRTIKDNMSKISNSFGKDLPANEFKQIVSSSRPSLSIKNKLGKIKYDDNETKEMFTTSKFRKDFIMEKHPELIETDKAKIERMFDAEKESEQRIENRIQEITDSIQIVIKDDEVNPKNNFNEKLEEKVESKEEINLDNTKSV